MALETLLNTPNVRLKNLILFFIDLFTIIFNYWILHKLMLRFLSLCILILNNYVKCTPNLYLFLLFFNNFKGYNININ